MECIKCAVDLVQNDDMIAHGDVLQPMRDDHHRLFPAQIQNRAPEPASGTRAARPPGQTCDGLARRSGLRGL